VLGSVGLAAVDRSCRYVFGDDECDWGGTLARKRMLCRHVRASLLLVRLLRGASFVVSRDFLFDHKIRCSDISHQATLTLGSNDAANSLLSRAA